MKPIVDFKKIKRVKRDSEILTEECCEAVQLRSKQWKMDVSIENMR